MNEILITQFAQVVKDTSGVCRAVNGKKIPKSTGGCGIDRLGARYERGADATRAASPLLDDLLRGCVVARPARGQSSFGGGGSAFGSFLS